MGADEEIEFRFLSDMADIERELGGLPKSADTAGRKMADKMDKHFARVEKKGKKAFGASKKEGTAAFAEIGEAGDRVMSELGGVFGDIGGAMSTFIEQGAKAGSVLGGTAGMATVAAGAIAGVTLAVGFGAMQIAEFIGGADVMIERLEEIAGSEALPDHTIAQLEEWDQAALGAEASATRLKVVLAGELAGAFIGAAHVAAVAADNLADVAEWAGQVGERLEWTRGVVRLTTGALSLGGTELARWALGLDELAESAGESAEGLVDLADGADLSTAAMNQAIRSAESFVAIQEAAILAMTGASTAEIAHFRALEQVDRATQAYVETLDLEVASEVALADAALQSAEVRKRQIQLDYDKAVSSRAVAAALKEEAANAAEVNAFIEEEARFFADLTAARSADAAASAEYHSAQVAEVIRLEEVRAQTDAAREARELEAHGQRVAREQQLAVLIAQAASDLLELGQQVMEANWEQAGENIAARQTEHDAWIEAEQARLDDLLERGKIDEDQHAAALQRLDVEGAATQEELDAEREAKNKHIRKQFAAHQALAIGQIMIDAAMAYMGLIASMAWMGPGAPFAAAAIVAPAVALSLHDVSEQTAPQFPGGGMLMDKSPDHVLVGMRPDEGAVSPRGMGAIGRDGLEEINRGNQPSQTTVLQIDRRVVAEAVDGVLRPRPGRLAGRINVYGSG